MRISEFCKTFQVSHQAVYAKIKKYAAELEGHISKDKGNVFVLDPFAVNLLKPKKASYKALDERNYYLFKKNKEIVSENEQFRAERDELASKMSDYEAVIEFLKKENKEYADSIALLTQECERYKKDCADAQALYRVMESEFDKEKAELTAEIKETEFGRKLLASTVSDQYKKLEEKDSRIHKLYKKSDEQENTIERLNKQLSIMTENVVQADAGGYVTYYAREGTKINANGAVYSLNSSKAADSGSSLSKDELADIRSNMQSFSKGFDASKFNSTYSFKYQLSGSILQYASDNSSVSTTSTVNEDGEEVTTTTTTVSSDPNIRRAQTDGIILYSTDGYESKTVDTVTAADFDQNSYQETDLKTDGQVNAGDDVYTIITDERWSLLIPLSEKQAANLKDRTSIRVKFLKDDLTQTGDFSIMEIDGSKYGRIDFNKGLIRYASDRFLEIELVTNNVTGLKVPLSSIVTKEFYAIPSKYMTTDKDTQQSGFMLSGRNKKGNSTTTFINTGIYGRDEVTDEKTQKVSYIYYVDKSKFNEGDAIIDPDSGEKFVIGDTEVLEGVYCINQGYAVFRRIEILDENEEYAVVSKETYNGLVRYDRIVKNADKVSEQDILY